MIDTDRPPPAPNSSAAPPAVIYLAAIDFPHEKARAIQIVNTCHALARAGRRVVLVVGRRSAPGHAASSLRADLARYGLAPHPNLRIVGLPVFRLPPGAPLQGWYTRFWNWSYLLGCLRLLPGLVRRSPPSTVLLVRDYRVAWLLLTLRRRHRRPLVFEVHGLPSAELLDARPATPAVRREADRRRRLEHHVFAGAWRLLTITDCLRQRLLDDYHLDPARVFTVPDATTAPTKRHVSNAAPSSPPSSFIRHPSSPSPPSPSFRRLIYVGQLYQHKGVDLLLRALALVPRAELSIVGGLPDDPQLAWLGRLAEQLGVADRVRFVGPRPYEQVPEVLAQAEVALLPLADGLVARCFTSPLKLFDYLAAGLPIVAVDFPTIREVLRDHHNGLLVPPDDPAAMAAAITRLLDDPALATRLGAQARRDVADYTWQRRAERILNALTGSAQSTDDGPRIRPGLSSMVHRSSP